MKNLFRRRVRTRPQFARATWNLSLPTTLDPAQAAGIQAEIAEAAQASPYG